MPRSTAPETIYLAGGLFNAAERVHNLLLEKALKKYGYQVVLPQRQAKAFVTPTGFDIDGVKKDCYSQAAHPSNLVVANLDGPDADSGTACEITAAAFTTGRVVVYRTDFRTDPQRELGVNAMLRPDGSHFIYEPCLFTELEEVEAFYDKLAAQIHESMQYLRSGGRYKEVLVEQQCA